MSKKGVVIWSIIILIVAAILRSVASVQQVIPWTPTATRILNTFLVFIIALTIYQVATRFIEAKNARKAVSYLFIAITLLALFLTYQGQILALGVSLGVMAFVFTIVFQAPLLNLAARIYLTAGAIYRKGDRIRIGEFKGDVIDLSLMSTQLLEVGGEYVKSDVPSGRVVNFPNSLVLSHSVLNYTREFPYVWVDIPFNISYKANIEFVQKLITKVVMKHIKSQLPKMEKSFTQFTKKHDAKATFTPINFDINPFGLWLEIRVTFPVLPSEQNNVTSSITADVLRQFKKYPKKAKTVS